jgi:hypothetical protein
MTAPETELSPNHTGTVLVCFIVVIYTVGWVDVGTGIKYVPRRLLVRLEKIMKIEGENVFFFFLTRDYFIVSHGFLGHSLTLQYLPVSRGNVTKLNNIKSAIF